MSMKLYVGNLSFNTSESELHELFSEAGTVESARIVTDRDTGRSRGFGFVEFATKEEGEAKKQPPKEDAKQAKQKKRKFWNPFSW